MYLFSAIDDTLNRLTMYRLVLYGLSLLLVIAELFCLTGILSYSAWGLAATTVLTLIVCYLANKTFAHLYKAPSNSESSLITALILACILPQATTPTRAIGIILAALIAMASKYILTWRWSMLVNPAAFGALVISLAGITSATWWIGNPSMLPLTIIFGLLVARKLRQFQVVTCFIAVSLVVSGIVALTHSTPLGEALKHAYASGPLIFLATSMFTEPSTMPSVKLYRYVYAILVAALFSAQIRFGSISLAPEYALVIGNLVMAGINPKQKVRLTLVRREQLTPHTFNFIFTSNRSLRFLAGQYMEWTLAHPKADNRGNRRSFTIASAPSTGEIHLGVKISERSSSYKQALMQLKPGDSLVAGNVRGDFILPVDKTTPLTWIAGGIGITPFQSMAQTLVNAQQQRDIALYHMVETVEDASYHHALQASHIAGITTHLITGPNRLSVELLQNNNSDFKIRHYYISGSPSTVRNTKKLLRQAGVPAKRIRCDSFSGY